MASQARIAPETDEAIKFLRRWRQIGGTWVLSTDDGGRFSTRTFGSDEEMRAWIEARQGRGNLYFSINPPRGKVSKKCTKDDIGRAIALHADIDPRPDAEQADGFEAERARILSQVRACRPKPSVIVDSGGGYWAFWLLREPLEVGTPDAIEKVEARNRFFRDQFQGGDSAHNIDRVARLPGTINIPNAKKLSKGRKPALTRIVEADWDLRYTLDDIPAADPISADRRKTKKANGDARSDYGSSDWNTLEPLDLDTLPAAITAKLKALIRSEKTPSRYKDDRSRWLFAVAVALAKAGCDDAAIMSALKVSPTIRSHINEQGDPSTYATRQIARAREEVDKATDTRPVIRYVATDPKAMAKEGEAALLEAGVELFQQTGRLVRIVRLPEAQVRGGIARDAGAVVLASATATWLRAEMMARARWVTSRVNSDGVVELIDAVLPRDVPDTFLELAGEWQVPVLRGVVEAPTLWRKGDEYVLLQTPGYDQASGLYYEPGTTKFPPLNPRPSDEDAVRAIDRLTGLLPEFPFVPDDAADDWKPDEMPGSTPSASRSVALSAILSGLIRRDMEAAPMHAFNAVTAGTGKGFLARLTSTIVTGRRAAAMPWVREVSEQRKRLFSVLLEGDAVVLLDNATEPIGGAPINVALSEPIFKDRILGRSSTGAPYTNVLMLATGNNLQFEGDFTRKVIVCRMDARMERPELREFKGNPLRDARENRGELVACALTVILAYLAAGRPQKGTVPHVASYEDWTLIREVLIWLGEPDPAITMEQVSVDDTEKLALLAVMDAWQRCYGSDAINPEAVARDLRRAAEPVDAKDELLHQLREALLSVLDAKDKELNAERIGRWVKRIEGRMIGKRRFVRQRSYQGGRQVRLDGAASPTLFE